MNQSSPADPRPATQRELETTFPLSPASNRRPSRNRTGEAPLGSSTSLQNVMPLEVVKNSFCRKLAMVFRKGCMKKISLYLKKKKKERVTHGIKDISTSTKTPGPTVRMKIYLGGQSQELGWGWDFESLPLYNWSLYNPSDDALRESF